MTIGVIASLAITALLAVVCYLVFRSGWRLKS